MSILAQLRKLSAESVISAPKTDVCIVDFDHEIKAYSQHLRYAKNTWDLCRKTTCSAANCTLNAANQTS